VGKKKRGLIGRGVTAIVAGLMATASLTPPAIAASDSATLTLHADRPGPIYDRRIFSQFAEHLGNGIYGGLWVGNDPKIPNTRGFRNDVVAALRAISVPVIRWPGGCFADEYHWREGIGPRANRPIKVNTNWGGVTEPNAVGTHEYMDLVEQIGAEPYISGNVGDGAPREMAEWVEYMTAPAGTLADERARNGHKAPWVVPQFGIGNELWGCGGNMRPDYAADVTRRYSTFLKVPDGSHLIKIASGANNDDYNWTDTMMRVAAKQIDAVSLHYYTVPGGWPPRASATQFDEAAWAETLSKAEHLDELITKHSAVMDKYDPQKHIFLAVDEWGTWLAQDPGSHPGFLRQQNTLRDAMVAAVTLNMFAAHADRVRVSAIAQMVNVLQAMVLTDGSRMVLTPTYHVYAMYKPFQDGTVIPLDLRSPNYSNASYTMPQVSAAAVRDKAGQVHVALANVDPDHPVSVTVALDGVQASQAHGQILTAAAMNALNSFDTPNGIKPVPFSAARIAGQKLSVTLPAKSIVMLDLR
jgi:alpha-N-arabinofuranosidase